MSATVEQLTLDGRVVVASLGSFRAGMRLGKSQRAVRSRYDVPVRLANTYAVEGAGVLAWT